MSAKSPQITVEDTGSTNRPGLRVTFDREGHASVAARNGESQHVRLSEAVCKRFMQDVDAAGPMNELPEAHCMKSVSFGSRIFVEYNGNRSPDVSCPSGEARTQALEKDAREILQVAREAAHIPSGRIFTVPARRPQ